MTSLLFMDDLRFIALGNSVKKMRKVLEEVAKIILQLDILTKVTYNIIKTDIVLFLKYYC